MGRMSAVHNTQRIVDVDDIFLNIVGALLGYGLHKCILNNSKTQCKREEQHGKQISKAYILPLSRVSDPDYVRARVADREIDMGKTYKYQLEDFGAAINRVNSSDYYL